MMSGGAQELYVVLGVESRSVVCVEMPFLLFYVSRNWSCILIPLLVVQLLSGHNRGNLWAGEA